MSEPRREGKWVTEAEAAEIEGTTVEQLRIDRGACPHCGKQIEDGGWHIPRLIEAAKQVLNSKRLDQRIYPLQQLRKALEPKE